MTLRCLALILSLSMTSGLRLVDNTRKEVRPALITTAYWSVKSKFGSQSESDAKYLEQMRPTMNLNADMVICGNDQSLELMTTARHPSKPQLVGVINREIETLAPCSWPSLKNLASHNLTDPINVPSVELGCIWSSKLALQEQSMEQHPDYQWYIWMDAGIHDPWVHRAMSNKGEPFPNVEKLSHMPDDKMFVGHSDRVNCDECKAWTYCHCISAMTWGVPKKLLPRMTRLFTEYQQKCIESIPQPAYPCLSEQVVLTRIAQDHPDLFFFVTNKASRWRYGQAANAILKEVINGTANEVSLIDWLSSPP